MFRSRVVGFLGLGRTLDRLLGAMLIGQLLPSFLGRDLSRQARVVLRRQLFVKGFTRPFGEGLTFASLLRPALCFLPRAALAGQLLAHVLKLPLNLYPGQRAA